MNIPALLLALITTTVIFSGCSKKETVEAPENVEEAEPVREIAKNKIQERNGIYYEVNQTTPFTGLSQEFYPNGQKKEELSFKDGYPHGVITTWYENGQKRGELNYKGGNKHGVETEWRWDGTKISETRYDYGVKKE